MQGRLSRVGIGTVAWLGSAVAALLAGNASADTRALSPSQDPPVRISGDAPVRISGYVSAGSELASPEAFRDGSRKLLRDASPPSPPAASGALFLNVSHDETR